MVTEELQSKVFDFLRFQLIIGVIFIHNFGIGGGAELVDAQSHTSLFYISNQLFSQIIGRIAVPLFFLMSGYLFYYKTDFDLPVYKKKLKSRSKSLLIPYLFWNAALIFVYFVVNKIPYISSFFQNSADYSFSYFIESFWGKADEPGSMSCPIAYQFWFIRDLMVVVVFTPLIFNFLKYTKEIGLAIIGLCWYLGLSIPYLGEYGFSSAAWFFFSLGAYFSINKKNLITLCSVFGNYIYLLYVIIVIGDFATIGLDIHSYIHKLGILIGIICCFNISAYLIDEKGIKVNSLLSKASFFVFAIHDPWILGTTKKIINKLFHLNSDITMTLMYFTEVIITVCVALLIYYLIKRTMPRFTAIISGGR